MNEEEKKFIENSSRSMWRERIDAPDHILEALLADFNGAMSKALRGTMKLDTETLLDKLELQARRPSPHEDHETMMAAITGRVRLLSDAPVMEPRAIATLFNDAGALSGLIGDVIRDPARLPEAHPDPVPFVATQFLYAARPCMPETLWSKTRDLRELKIMAGMADINTYPLAMAGRRALDALGYAQKHARGLPFCADALVKAGHGNLAVIAHCLAQRCVVIADDIIVRVDYNLQKGLPLSLSALRP